MRNLITFLLLISLAGFAQAEQITDKKLTVGITLHPYYSYVANVLGDKGEVLPLIETGFNPHNYSLNPADIARLNELDALVINGIGHDEFVVHAVDRVNPQNLTMIYANKDVPLLGHGGKSNPHTFVSIDAAIRQVYSIAKGLGKVDPSNAKYFSKNAFLYAKKLRTLKKNVQNILINKDLSKVKIASTHNAYGYLLQEFGLTVSAVVEPAHGVKPSASQLQATIDEIRKADIDVLFTELNMANSYVDLIEKETGIKIYHFSHMTHGDYTKELVELEMRHNINKLAEALIYAANKAG
ncbi:MAG: zinc ABC transporter substrate-binding protein [Thalassotalea sp.]|nr:zinc ABC transporter substrate-binding protein [Thalassotalea sp.]